MTAESDSKLNPSSTAAVAPTGERAACRRFTLADALILIAGLAIVLSMGTHLLRFSAESFVGIFHTIAANRVDLWESWPRFWRALREPVITTIWYGSQFFGTMLFGMTPIFFVLRLRRPRPRWRALLVQPGMVAGLAMVFGLFWVLGLVQIMLPNRLDSIHGPGLVIGGTVAAFWLILLLCRKWNAEQGWVDRLGRILGAMAIGTSLLGLVIYRI
jgi:hypothetical protein